MCWKFGSFGIVLTISYIIYIMDQTKANLRQAIRYSPIAVLIFIISGILVVADIIF
jgi:hypothetical protein